MKKRKKNKKYLGSFLSEMYISSLNPFNKNISSCDKS